MIHLNRIFLDNLRQMSGTENKGFILFKTGVGRGRNPMRFQYILSGSGWAEGFIEVNSQRCDFNPSYLTDALGDLLDSFLQILLYEPNPKKNHFNKVSFCWDEEPNGTEWILTRLENEKVSLVIKSFNDIYSKSTEQGSVVINTICNFTDLLSEIIREVDGLLTKHGIAGYKESWLNHEFPLSSFLRLKHFLHLNQQLKVEFIPEELKGYGGFYKSNLTEELSLISGKTND